MMKRTIFLFFIVALSLSALGGGCAPPPVTSASTPEKAPASESAVVPNAVIKNAIIKIEVTDWAWTPDVITIKSGETVTLELTNTGKMPHGIWIPELGINEGVRSGKTILVDIVAPSNPTEFTIKCNDPECGTMARHNDMVAILTVIE